MGSIMGEIHVLLGAWVLFLVLPWLALGRRIPNPASWITAGLSFWILAVSALSYVSMVRYAVLLVSAVVGIVWIRRASRDKESTKGDRSPRIHLLEVFERPMEQGRKLWQGVWDSLRERTARRLAVFGWMEFGMVSLALVVALMVGSWPWLHQVAPGTPNGYTNLLGTAGVAADRRPYAGAAPVGLSALGAALSVAFFLPAMDVVRFLYPLTMVLTVVAVGALAYQVTRSPRVTALVMVWVSVARLSHFGLPINFETPSAIHWGLVLVLLGLAEWVASRRDSSPWHLVIGGIALFAVALINPFLALIGIFMGGVILAGRGGAWEHLVLKALGMTALAGVSIAFILTATKPLSDGWLVGAFPPLVSIWHARHLTSAPYLVVWIGLAVSVISFWRHADPMRRRLNGALAGLALLEGAFGNVAGFASAVLWSGLLGLLALVSGVDLLLEGGPFRGRNARGRILGLMAGLSAIAVVFPANPVTLKRYEPALAARTTLRIETHFSPYQWTIISPVQQFSETFGRGWHMELVSFVQTYPIQDARNPHFQLMRDRKNPIVSPDVFLFVEPIIYPFGRVVSRNDLRIPVKAGGQAYQGRSLLGIESRAYYWAIAYHRSHPYTSQIYARNSHLMVLWIHQ